MPKKSPHARTSTKKRPKKSLAEEEIIIDSEKGLIFKTEEEILKYFSGHIEKLEGEYLELRKETDFTDKEQMGLEDYLDQCLESPDEIWREEDTFKDFPLHIFIKAVDDPGKNFSYVAIAYMSADQESPPFVFLHFPTRDQELVTHYRRGELVYDRLFEMISPGAIEGDALSEGEILSMGLFTSMLKLRSDKDIPLEQFGDFAPLREDTIENADEIWRKADGSGNLLVTFIRQFPDHPTKDLFYLAVTAEDSSSNVHSLLFSFPTVDESLVDRYRQGENLQAEEIVQESSH
jgi:hypothetical protein